MQINENTYQQIVIAAAATLFAWMIFGWKVMTNMINEAF